MADGRSRDEWSRMSALMALTANCHRDPKKSRATKPSDFDPHARSAPIPKVGVEVLKDVFVHGRVPDSQHGG